MYNPEIIYKMLLERGLQHKDLMKFLGKNPKHSLRQSINGDPKASTLERIADFFSVPIDTFFERDLPSNNGVIVSGVGNHAVNIRVNSPEARVDVLEALLSEKDKRIAILEELVEALRRNQETK